MLKDLINYFEPIESEDRMVLLTDLAAMFEDYSNTTVDIDTSLMIDDSRSASELAPQVWDRAYIIIERAMDEMLVAMGLNVEAAPLLFKLDLLNACKTIEVTGMHEYVLETANNDSVPLAERFESLIEFALGRQVPELFDYLEEVPLSLMNRIYMAHKAYVENATAIDMSKSIDYTKEISRIKNFFSYCKHKKITLRLHELIEAGVKPLMRTEFLLSNNADLLKELEPEAPDHAAIELIGLLLLCDIDFSNINAVVGKYAELYFTDTDFISRLSSQATEIISSSNITGVVNPTEDIQWTNSNSLGWL